MRTSYIVIIMQIANPQPSYGAGRQRPDPVPGDFSCVPVADVCLDYYWPSSVACAGRRLRDCRVQLGSRDAASWDAYANTGRRLPDAEITRLAAQPRNTV